MERILLICFILGAGSFAMCSCGKKEDDIAKYAPKEEISVIKVENDSTSPVEGEELKDENVRELTMETLLELYENDGLKLKAEEGLEGFLAYENMKSVSGMEDSLTGLYICDLVYPHMSENGTISDRNYELQLYYWRPETAGEYGHTENEIDNILLMEKESHDAVLLYAVDDRFIVTKVLQGFLLRDYGMDQYLVCDLPGDFTLGMYREDIGFCGGWLLEGETDTPPHDEWIPEAWYCFGGIGRGETASQVLKFENGALTDAALMMNHTEQLSETEILEDCETQAVLAEYAFDLFTASGWEDYLSKHPGTEEVLKSHYWYVFLGKEDSEVFYVLFLNQEHFTRGDAIRMAQSVRFTEKAF